MWSYYGSKTNIAHQYPKPQFNTIIEPFAGAAKYSLEHFENDVTLVDKDETVIKLWQWLQRCSVKDITSLPRMKTGELTSDYCFDCEEQKILMGFLIGYGLTYPANKASPSLSERPGRLEHSIKIISQQLHKIRHWNIYAGSYDQIDNKRATWFVDPPYQVGGHSYRESNRNIDFKHLADWCTSREGQAIVCENNRADWLPFIPMVQAHGAKGRKQFECIWSNVPTIFHNQQLALL